ncbi:MAG TPA: GTP-binding protein [Isosphaeraceae bacterium]|nr:GTP-binding protein [Isosphaeraceae bacterium]
MQKSSWTILLTILGLLLALCLLGWFLASIGDLHERISKFSPALAAGVIGMALVAASAAALMAAHMFWKMGRNPEPPAQAPEDVVRAAEVQTEKAEQVLSLVQDEAFRERLNRELAQIRADRETRQFHLVIFGTGSAGKTSLISALLGRKVGPSEPTLGTTKHGETFTFEVDGLEGRLVVTDTPGLSEIGDSGALREAEARDLAARADLLLFVVDHDLTRSEFDPLAALAKQGKRSIIVLNKLDRLVDADREAILARLRERLRGIVSADDIVAVAASPRPVEVRQTNPDGSVETIEEPQPPDLADLQDRIVRLLQREGESLRAGNLLLRAHLVSREAQDYLTGERRQRARKVVEKFQWVTAAAVFANPIPALDLMATGAVQFQMISEIASAYGVSISTAHAKMIAGQMVQMLLKLGLVEAASSLIAGIFKASFVGFAAGGAVQATSMAYLTHISGLAFTEYFERGQSWGDGGMQAALTRQFDLHRRAEFLKEFAGQALDRVVKRWNQPKSKAETPR